MTHTPVVPAVVVGAGPYGLSVAAHLRGLGVPVRVFGEPMNSWRHQMPAGMYLKSHADAASLSAPEAGHTLVDFCRAQGEEPFDDERPVPLATFVRYGMWFQERLVPDVERVWVRDLRQHGEDLRVTLATGEELLARSAVLATGLDGYAHVPAEVVGLASHSSQHHDMSLLAGSDVVVIGAGQSALEGATLLHEAGAQVRLLARHPPLFAGPTSYRDGRAPSTPWQPFSKLGHGWALWTYSTLPGGYRHLPEAARLRLSWRVLGPYGSAWLRDRFEGRVPVHIGWPMSSSSTEDGKVRLDVLDPRTGAGDTLLADHVIAGTGFRVNIDALGFLAASTRAAVARTRGVPRLAATFESTVPGLFFVGHSAALTFGPVMRFVCGAGFAARRVSVAVAARLR